MDPLTLLGSVGAAIILLFFFLNQAHKVSNDSYIYDFFNFVGGVILIIYAYLLGSWPFLILNSIWTLVSLKDLIFKKK